MMDARWAGFYRELARYEIRNKASLGSRHAIHRGLVALGAQGPVSDLIDENDLRANDQLSRGGSTLVYTWTDRRWLDSVARIDEHLAVRRIDEQECNEVLAGHPAQFVTIEHGAGARTSVVLELDRLDAERVATFTIYGVLGSEYLHTVLYALVGVPGMVPGDLADAGYRQHLACLGLWRQAKR